MTQLKLTTAALLLILAAPGLLLASDSPRTITVQGQAELKVVPDEVVLNLGVETHDEDLQQAKKDNDRRTAAVRQTAREHGVENRQLVTDYLNIAPYYRDQYLSNERVSFQVRRSLVVTLRQVDRFESLLSAALEAGASHVHGVQFRTTELRKHRDKARALALDAAREKATDMAEQLGETVGRPRTISEGHSGWSSPYGWWWGGGGQSMFQNVVQVEPSAESATTPGQITVSARVSVTFELAD